MSELANLIKDARNDMKRLIEALIALNDHLSKLEAFMDSIAKFTKELEETNKNIKTFIDIIKELK